MNITIIGAGKVGAYAALSCGLRELGNVLLLDIIQGLPQGEAMDINHELAERGSDCKVSGSNNYEDMKGSDVVVLVAGVGRKPGMTRMDLLKTNESIVTDVASKIVAYARDSKFIVVTNPLDPMTYLVLKKTGVKKNNVMGMGGMLDLSRFKNFIAETANVSRDSIQAMVIGEHGENMLPLTRFSSVGGIPLAQFISDHDASKIFEKTRKVAIEVISLKGATVFAPGNAIASMVESIIRDKKSVIPVSTLLEGEYGASGVCIGVPAVVGSSGVEKIIELKLDRIELDIFSKGVKNVKEAVNALQV
ncbi:MAG TPA: malate dehydrogenase [Nitrososphaeraceae archaeon]|nr:malate dehydrogenase [Nitrososphaeraceae archaeon]